MSMLARIQGPRDLDALTPAELDDLAVEIREFLVEKVSRTGGHLGPNLGVVEMTIKSPDGKEQINVAGKVVWSEEKKRYGVAFQGADTSVLNSIGRWTTNLLKAS